LTAACLVDDGQTAMAQTDTLSLPQSFIIWPSVLLALQGRLHPILLLLAADLGVIH
jgi:hypothetical protein